jgi:hypothetical protein
VERFTGDDYDAFVIPHGAIEVNEPVEIMRRNEEPLQLDLDNALSEYDLKDVEVGRLLQRVNEVRMEQELSQSDGPDYRRMSGRTSRRANNDHVLAERLTAAVQEWEEAKLQRNQAETIVTEKRNALEANRLGKLITTNDFLQYALDIINPSIKYFIENMRGKLDDIRIGCRAVRCFDPFFVRDKDIVTLRAHVHDLSRLNLPSLTNECIHGILQSELEQLKQEVVQCLGLGLGYL